jgi:hypothetical protein
MVGSDIESEENQYVCSMMIGSDIESEENQYVVWWLVVI